VSKSKELEIRTCSDTLTNNAWEAIIHLQHSLTILTITSTSNYNHNAWQE